MKPDGTKMWLNYYSSPWQTHFTAVRFSPHEIFTTDTTYDTFVAALLKSSSVLDLQHSVLFIDYATGAISKAIPFPKEQPPTQE